jgi:ELWxxDGT repeat protein
MKFRSLRRSSADARSVGDRNLRMEPLESRQLLSATPTMLTDSGGVENSGIANPHGFTDVNGVTYFATGRPQYPQSLDLWRTDGSAAGTRRVTDDGMALVGEMINFNGTLYFAGGRRNFSTPVLYQTDGTSNGTIQVKQQNSLATSDYPSDFVAMGDTLFFLCRDNNGVELWRVDQGVAARVKGIYSGSSTGISSLDVKLTNVNGTLYFKANDGATGIELWKSDGTAAGTVLVKDILPGAVGGLRSTHTEVDDFINVGGVLYFGANDGTSGRELWRSDGTEAGTFRVKDVAAGASSSSPDQFTEFNGKLFFTANNGQLWSSDGTEAGTSDIYNATINPQQMTVVNNALFYTTGSSTSALWKSDGTAAGTKKFVLQVGNNVGVNPRQLAAVGNELYLIANTTGPEIWRTDGTPTGTAWTGDVLADGVGTPRYLTDVAGKLFFTAAPPNGFGSAVYISDGTGPGTRFVKDVASESTGSQPVELAALNDSLFFQAKDFTQSKLWTTDGTTTGTLPFLSTLSQPIYWATSVGDTVFFITNSSQVGNELWKSDGTAAGTMLVKDIAPGTAGAFFSYWSHPLFNANGTLYFVAYEPATGLEVWKSDGTAAGTTLVKDVTPGSNSSFMTPELDTVNFTLVGDAVYFVVYDGERSKLWRTDGTEAGTVEVRDFQYRISNLVVKDELLYFAAWTAETGSSLWKSDGTAAGTTLVKSYGLRAWDGVLIQQSKALIAVGDTLFFLVNSGDPSNFNLWKSDGTTEGTSLVSNALLGANPNFVAAGSTLYFVSYAQGPRRLWKSDGTVDGTYYIPSEFDSVYIGEEPLQAADVSGQLYFIATRSTTGRELWRTDGTRITLVSDIRPGNSNSNVGNLLNVNGDLYFTANDGAHGEELWVVRQEAAIERGDYDLNNVVDGADFLKWQRAFDSADQSVDGDGDGTVDGGDLDVWRENFGLPESASPLNEVATMAALVAEEEDSAEAEFAATSLSGAMDDAAEPGQRARDALFAGGDFSRLFGLGGDGEFENSLRRRGRGVGVRR